MGDVEAIGRVAGPGGEPGPQREPPVTVDGFETADAAVPGPDDAAARGHDDGERPSEPAREPEGETTSVYLPPFRIDVTVRPGVPHAVSRHRAAEIARHALDAAGAPHPSSLGIVLSDNSELAELNAAHMGVSGTTDVLSFPFLPAEAFADHPRGEGRRRDHGVAAALKQAFALPPGLRAHLGDIVLSIEQAMAQAAGGHGGQTGDVGWPPSEEIALLIVHGTLHVCGWDHAEPVEEAAMRALEREILATLGEHRE